MKKIVLVLTLMSCFFSSCYKDNSNKDINPISPIIIDMENNLNNITVSQYDILEINPNIYIENEPDAPIDCRWVISRNTIQPITLDSVAHLKVQINVPPQSSVYSLLLTVTDLRNGLQKFKEIFLTVKPALAEGLVVADTKDGINSDLSVIVSRHFNSSKKWPDTRVFKNIYSSTNNSTIPGLIKDVKTKGLGTNRTLTVMTDNSIIRADYYDYKRIDKECDKGIFMFPPEGELKPDFIEFDSYYGDELICANGLLYPRPTQNRLCQVLIYPAGRFSYYVTHSIGIMYGHVWFFDKEGEKLLMLKDRKLMEPKPQNPAGAFDINNFKGYEPVLFGQPSPSEIHFVMRQKATGDIIDFAGTTLADNGNNVPVKVINLSSGNEIKNAKYFAMGALEQRLYYATEKTLYSISLENNSTKVQFTPKDGEIITDIKVWSEYYGKVMIKSSDTETGTKEISSTNRMMLVTTYNQTKNEGKITVVPISTVNADIEQDRNLHVEYGGFGRILKICRQDR